MLSSDIKYEIDSKDKLEELNDYYISETIRSLESERNYIIICTRLGLFNEPKTLQETGNEFGVSRERIRKIVERFYFRLNYFPGTKRKKR